VPPGDWKDGAAGSHGPVLQLRISRSRSPVATSRLGEFCHRGAFLRVLVNAIFARSAHSSSKLHLGFCHFSYTWISSSKLWIQAGDWTRCTTVAGFDVYSDIVARMGLPVFGIVDPDYASFLFPLWCVDLYCYRSHLQTYVHPVAGKF
jgi:hypothetical protein